MGKCKFYVKSDFEFERVRVANLNEMRSYQ